MRKTAVTLACLLVAGCGGQRTVLLPASEVLHRSVVASNTLDSFAYSVDASLRLSDGGTGLAMTGALRTRGSLRRERTIATGLGTVETTVLEGSGLHRMGINGAYALVPQQRPSVRIDSVTTESGAIAQIRDAGGRWLSLPVTDSASPLQSTSHIDQKWIAFQSSALRVTRKLSVEELGDGDAYRLAVALDPDQLEAILGPDAADADFRDALRDRLSGELWIDAETFLLKRAVWSLRDAKTDRGLLSVDVDITFSDHNRATAEIAPPMPDEIEYPDDAIFATIFSGALLPFMEW